MSIKSLPTHSDEYVKCALSAMTDEQKDEVKYYVDRYREQWVAVQLVLKRALLTPEEQKTFDVLQAAETRSLAFEAIRWAESLTLIDAAIAALPIKPIKKPTKKVVCAK
jgi:hypothetical protein